jgi:hypothetical protein
MLDFHETKRLAFLAEHKTDVNPESHTKRRKFVSNAAVKGRRVVVKRNLSIKPGMRQLVRFLELMAHLDKADWANKLFYVNQSMIRRLTHAHLPLIVGDEHYRAEKNELEALINAPDPAQNILWVTNRQQGKTSTLAKFLACLTVLSPASGSLVMVYSITLFRAIEVIRGAKRYIYWLKTGDENHKPHADTPTIVKDNQFTLEVITIYGTQHAITARPKSTNSCRGDAPHAAFFDEFAFMTLDFWNKFAYPLLQVGNRVFTCATTPPHFESPFNAFINDVKDQNKQNNFFFRLVNHSLVCEDCDDKDLQSQCVHRLSLVPPWKSLSRLQQMRSFVSDNNMHTFETEVYGVLEKRTNTYLPAKLCEDTFISASVLTRCTSPRSEPVYIAVDPPSHGVSNFGVAAIMYGSSGEYVVLGAAEISAKRCEVIQLQASIGEFIKRIRAHSWARGRNIVPIIECNNNEIISQAILKIFYAYPPITMPFVKQYFTEAITDSVGVWTTEQNKVAMLHGCYQALLDNRIRLAPGGVTVSKAAYQINAEEGSWPKTRELLANELKCFRDLPNGKITGRMVDGQTDDVGMAFLMCLYWSRCVRSLNVRK